MKRLDYSKMQQLIDDKIPTREIASIMGCGTSIINDFKRSIGKGSNRKPAHREDSETREYVTPPADRERLLLERKTADFSEAHRAAFLKGIAYRQTLEGM